MIVSLKWPVRNIIVTAELTNCSADNQQLHKVLEAVKQNTDASPQQFFADAGCRSETVFQALREHLAYLIVALGRKEKQEVDIPRTRIFCQRPWLTNSNRSSRKKRIGGVNGLAELPNG